MNDDKKVKGKTEALKVVIYNGLRPVPEMLDKDQWEMVEILFRALVVMTRWAREGLLSNEKKNDEDNNANRHGAPHNGA